MPSIPSQVNTLGNATVQDRPSAAQQGTSRPLTAAVDDEHCAATQEKGRPSMTRVGDTRLEVLLSGSLEARVGLASKISMSCVLELLLGTGLNDLKHTSRVCVMLVCLQAVYGCWPSLPPMFELCRRTL